MNRCVLSATNSTDLPKGVTARAVLKRMLWLAYKASSLQGLGIFQANDNATEDSIAALHITDAGIMADYVHGRMVKLYVHMSKDGDILLSEFGEPSLSYQSWAGTYKTIHALFDAAIFSLSVVADDTAVPVQAEAGAVSTASAAAARLPFLSMMLEHIIKMMDVPADSYVAAAKKIIQEHLDEAAIVLKEENGTGKPCGRRDCTCHLSPLERIKEKAARTVKFIEKEPAAGLALAVLISINQQMQWSVESFREISEALMDSLGNAAMDWLENPEGRFRWGLDGAVTAASPMPKILEALRVPSDQYHVEIIDVREMVRRQEEKRKNNPAAKLKELLRSL